MTSNGGHGGKSVVAGGHQKTHGSGKSRPSASESESQGS